MALTMLLMLKQFLKFTYAVSDVRLAQYLPDKAARRKQVCMRALSCVVGLDVHAIPMQYKPAVRCHSPRWEWAMLHSGPRLVGAAGNGGLQHKYGILLQGCWHDFQVQHAAVASLAQGSAAQRFPDSGTPENVTSGCCG